MVTAGPADEQVVGELVRLDFDPILTDPRMQAAYARAGEFARAAKASSTRAAYEDGWRHFTTWCATVPPVPLPSLPADVQTVVLYIGDSADQAAWSTLNVRLAAIKHFHEDADHLSPTGHPAVKRVMAGVKRTLGAGAGGKTAITLDQLREMVRAIRADDQVQPLARLRNIALLLVTAYLGWRRSEVAALMLPDVRRVGGGLVFTLGASKSDQTGQRGRKVTIRVNVEDPEMCAVTALLDWVLNAGLDDQLGRKPRGEEPPAGLWRGVTAQNKLRKSPLTGQVLATVVKHAAVAAGLDVELEDLAAHSLRKLFVTEALAGGADLPAVMASTGHTSVPTVLGYDQRGARAAPSTVLFQKKDNAGA